MRFSVFSLIFMYAYIVLIFPIYCWLYLPAARALIANRCAMAAARPAPAKVTLSRSPPNAPRLVRSQRKAINWSWSPTFENDEGLPEDRKPTQRKGRIRKGDHASGENHSSSSPPVQHRQQAHKPFMAPWPWSNGVYNLNRDLSSHDLCRSEVIKLAF